VGIARPNGRARIETTKFDVDALNHPASPGRMVGRGLKHAGNRGRGHGGYASPGRMVGRGLKHYVADMTSKGRAASPGRMVGRGLKHNADVQD